MKSPIRFSGEKFVGSRGNAGFVGNVEFFFLSVGVVLLPYQMSAGIGVVRRWCLGFTVGLPLERPNKTRCLLTGNWRVAAGPFSLRLDRF